MTLFITTDKNPFSRRRMWWEKDKEKVSKQFPCAYVKCVDIFVEAKLEKGISFELMSD